MILPSPWQTLPAYAALGLLAVAGIWRLSSRSQRRRHERLEAQVRERTAQLAHTVSELQRSDGMATVLQGTPLSLEQHDHVETIRSSGESLLSLLNEVLDFSKIDAGMIEVESRPCALLGPNPPQRILVVEDNSINQKVVQLLLKRLGCRADMAANGLEALAALRRQPYDLVLMDVQMPGMDGMETTRRIRAGLPQGAGPVIVAMTAHAWREAREACLESGMDDFLSKPLVLEDLARVLRQAAGPRSSDAPPPPPPSTTPPPVEAGLAFDPHPLQSLRGLEEMTGRAVVDELVERFLGEARLRLDRLRHAAGAGDAKGLSAVAHSLRGSSAQLGALRLAGLSETLEELGRRDTCEGAADLLEQLAAELARLEPAMRAELAQAG